MLLLKLFIFIVVMLVFEKPIMSVIDDFNCIRKFKNNPHHTETISATLILVVILATSMANIYSSGSDKFDVHELPAMLTIGYSLDVVSIVLYYIYHIYLFNSERVFDLLMDALLLLYLIITSFSFMFLVILPVYADQVSVIPDEVLSIFFSLGYFIGFNIFIGLIFGFYSIVVVSILLYSTFFKILDYVLSNAVNLIHRFLNWVFDMFHKIK